MQSQTSQRGKGLRSIGRKLATRDAIYVHIISARSITNMADFEAKFNEAIQLACGLLQVRSFYEEQKEALRQFFLGKDLFFSVHTGYGVMRNH